MSRNYTFKKGRKIDSSKLNIIICDKADKNSILAFCRFLPATIKKRMQESLKDFKSNTNFIEKWALTEGGFVVVIASNPELPKSLFHAKISDTLSSVFSPKACSKALVFGSDKTHFELLEDLAFLAAVSKWKHPKVKADSTKAKEVSLNFSWELHGFSNKILCSDYIHRGETFAEAVIFTKTLAHMPANFLTPTHFMEEAKSLAKKQKWGFKFYSEAELKKQNAGAFLAVCRGSTKQEAGIVHITIGSKLKSAKTIAFVGKGICFDTGGYNVKTGNYMFNMHHDMTGAAQALAMGIACSKQNLEAQIDIYLALAENHISPEAYKMNEVVFASNGKSIEVIHTDAEGRMVLADTLAIASKQKPHLLIDFATLTGSAIRAIGTKRAAVFCSDSSAFHHLFESSKKTGEEVWPFPQGMEYEEALESKVADLKQCDSGFNADHIYATTFLGHFVDKSIHWIHMDLSPVDGKGAGLIPFDGIGFGIRWSYDYTKKFLEMPNS